MQESAASRGSRSADTKSISSSLLQRVKIQDPRAWERLAELYGPVVYRWCRKSWLNAEDAVDVVQEVFRSLVSHVGDFRRERPGDSFAAWLRTITRNKVRDLFRQRQGQARGQGGTEAQQRLLQVPEAAELAGEDPDDGSGSILTHRSLELVRAEFEDRTWQAFWQAAVDGRSPADVAADLGISVQSVYQAKYRVLKRIRQEMSGLID